MIYDRFKKDRDEEIEVGSVTVNVKRLKKS